MAEFLGVLTYVTCIAVYWLIANKYDQLTIKRLPFIAITAALVFLLFGFEPAFNGPQAGLLVVGFNAICAMRVNELEMDYEWRTPFMPLSIVLLPIAWPYFALARPYPKLPIHAYAAEGSIEKVQAQLAAGVDVNVEARNMGTPLMFAARYGKVEMVDFLLRAGANLGSAEFIAETWHHERLIEYFRQMRAHEAKPKARRKAEP